MLRRLSVTVAAGVVLSVAPAVAVLRTTPSFSVPFPCGQTWTGATRTSHRPPQAIDFNRPGDEGDLVVASAPGTVVVAEPDHASYGGVVIVDHGDGWETYSAHLAAVTVAVGDTVARAEAIGTVGDTGRSDGPHLHYEQRLHGRPMRTVFHARETPSQAVLTFRTAAC